MRAIAFAILFVGSILYEYTHKSNSDMDELFLHTAKVILLGATLFCIGAGI